MSEASKGRYHDIKPSIIALKCDFHIKKRGNPVFNKFQKLQII